MNVIIHSLLHIPPLRDHLLLSNFRGKEPELLKRFAGLAKKIWNPRLFKSQVSPHEFLQEVNRASAGKFRLEQQGDPVEFLGWLLNRLHKDFGGSKKKDSSAVYSFSVSVTLTDISQVSSLRHSKANLELKLNKFSSELILERMWNPILTLTGVRLIPKKNPSIFWQLIRAQNFHLAIFISCAGPASSSFIPGCCREEHYSSSYLTLSFGEVWWENVTGTLDITGYRSCLLIHLLGICWASTPL